MQTILTNSIICGDCKDKMHQHIPSGSIDLIYMDPPFFSGKNYEIVWSFEDTEFYTLECECGKVFPENHLYCAFCGAGKDKATERRSNDIEAYLQWLRPKLEECYRVLKQTGSIYVHLDWHAVHYVKVMMDDIFGGGDITKGMKHLKNEIVWHYKSVSNVKNDFARKHDTILRYTKGKEHTFNMDDVREPYDEKTVKRYKNPVKFPNGYEAKMNKKGKAPDDVWVIPPIRNVSKERLGYPTQKPELLLERIIKSSSNPGDTVLDPFCGCGTAVAVAQKLGRRWIGIDVSPTSCRLMTDRLRKIGYSIGVSDIIDMPQTSDELKDMEPFEFQNWVVQQLGGRQVSRRSGDRGIDGWTFEGDPIQVKQSEKVGTPVVRLFAQDIRDVDKTRGTIVALSFGKGAYSEVDHVKAKHGIDIELKTVAEMIE